MKKYLIYIFGVSIVFLVSLSFMDISKDTDEITTVSENFKTASFFQIGAFKEKDIAYNLKNKENAVIEYDGEYYYVYKSILFEKENIDRMINYLNSMNYYYYIKNKSMSNEIYEKIKRIEKTMLNSSSNTALIRINNNLIKEYEEIYEN